jgi:prolyl-tRNA synthetase
VRTIDELAAAPYSRPATQQLKTLVYIADDAMVLAVVRGDDDLNEAKLQTAVGATLLRPALPNEIQAALGAKPGSLGAVGVNPKASGSKVARVLVDRALQGLAGMVTGANEDGFHLEGVDVARDLAAAEVADLRRVKSGERCTRCESGKLELFKALEVGHIFKLGTKYSQTLGASVLDEAGREVPIVMGSYGIGVERIAAAAVELHHDQNGILWPMSICPFQVALLTLQAKEQDVVDTAERLYNTLVEAGVEVLYDDRDERPGVKFKDADLIGLPLRIAVGKKSLGEGRVELKARAASDVELVAVDDVLARVLQEIAAGLAALQPKAQP